MPSAGADAPVVRVALALADAMKELTREERAWITFTSWLKMIRTRRC
jgi:hypothetical protein